MKQLTGLLLLGMMVAFIGCDAAKEKLDAAKKTGTEMVDGAKDMANIDFGSFDFNGLREKFAGVTDGFKEVTADNVDGLTSKISSLSGSLEGMGIGNLSGAAKTAVTGAITKFIDAIKTAMDGISDDGILSKLKPVVDGLMEKLKAFK